MRASRASLPAPFRCPSMTPGRPLAKSGVGDAGPPTADWRQPAARSLFVGQPLPTVYPAQTKPREGPGMKKLILACSLLLAATGAHAQGTGSNPNSDPVQAYTTLGPAGAGTY